MRLEQAIAQDRLTCAPDSCHEAISVHVFPSTGSTWIWGMGDRVAPTAALSAGVPELTWRVLAHVKCGARLLAVGQGICIAGASPLAGMRELPTGKGMRYRKGQGDNSRKRRQAPESGQLKVVTSAATDAERDAKVEEIHRVPPPDQTAA